MQMLPGEVAELTTRIYVDVVHRYIGNIRVPIEELPAESSSTVLLIRISIIFPSGSVTLKKCCVTDPDRGNSL